MTPNKQEIRKAIKATIRRQGQKKLIYDKNLRAIVSVSLKGERKVEIQY